MTREDLPANFSEWWPCACVKRDKQGSMTNIKCHHPDTKRCRVCGCNRPPKSIDKETT